MSIQDREGTYRQVLASYINAGIVEYMVDPSTIQIRLYDLILVVLQTYPSFEPSIKWHYFDREFAVA